MGIGLPLACSLASLHQGELYLDVDYPDNSFVLSVPLGNKSTSLPQNAELAQAGIAVLDEESVTDTELKGCTLLLVEDNEAMLEFMQERLRETFTVEIARHGAEALEILRNTRIDLVISDIMMPMMNGWDLCKDRPESHPSDFPDGKE